MEEQKKYEILNSLPSYGPMSIPISESGKKFYYEGFVVRFYKDDGTEWIVNFDSGWEGIDKVFEYSKENLIVVFAGGTGYVMNPNKEKPIKIIGHGTDQVFQVNSGELICIDNIKIQLFNPKTSDIWISEQISWDGFKELSFENGIIKGKSFDPTNPLQEWSDFSFNIVSKEITGGSFKISESQNLLINVLLGITIIPTSTFLCYIFYRTSKSESILIPTMIFPIFLGILFENKRLSTDWKIIYLKFIIALFISISVFIHGITKQDYNFENYIEKWAYLFIISFGIVSMFNHKKKIIPKLTEGITLLQSISIIYWIIDLNNIFSFILICPTLIFCLGSFIHAFSYIKLTRRSRLFLSIWSSLIMIIFAIDHIYRVFNFKYFIDNKTINDGVNTVQYFLLGISLIYIFQNMYMLLVYLPDKRWYNEDKINDIKIMNNTHIERYSNSQIKITDALIVLLFTSGIYYLNYHYKIIPRNTLIWILFWIFPFIIWCKELIIKKIGFKITAKK